MKQPILLIGGGGHAKSIIDTLLTSRQFEIIGILDNREKIGEKVSGIEIIDTDEKLKFYFDQGIKNAFVCVGSVGIPALRSKLYKQVEANGFILPNVIDSTAIVAKNVKLGSGNFIGKGAILNADCTVGNGCIINTRSIIEHDCCIGDFVHIAPGCTLCGEVKIGSYTHVGAGSVVIEQKQIGCGTIIGAGSTVVMNIDNEVKAYGNPCRTVEKR